MLVKILFWCAVTAVIIGSNCADGNLFYFFAAHLTTVSAVLALRRREKQGRGRATANPVVVRSSGTAPKPNAA